MNRWSVGVVVAVVAGCAAVILAGCGTTPTAGRGLQSSQQPAAESSPAAAPGTCSALTLDIAPGVRGAATAAEAIATFRRAGTAPFAVPAGGWTSTDGRRYVSGTTQIDMFRLRSGRFVVTGADSCPAGRLVVPSSG